SLEDDQPIIVQADDEEEVTSE
nr:hypothetical protein [Tanacetum cinerariifolium]